MRRLEPVVITGSPIRVLRYNQAALALLIPVHPWLALRRPKCAVFHGAECRNSPELVIRSACRANSVYSSKAPIASLVIFLFVSLAMITLMPLRVSQPGLPPLT